MSQPASAAGKGGTLRDYLDVVWRRKWVVFVVVVLAAGSAYLLSARQTAVYESSTQLMFEDPVDVANPLSSSQYVDPTQRTVELQGVSSVIASPEMEARARAVMAEQGEGIPGADHSVEAHVVKASDEIGTGTTYSSVVAVVARSSDARVAALAADSYATTFIELRKERQRQQIDEAITVVRETLGSMRSEAERMSSDYIMLQQRLHDLQILKGTTSGGFRIIVPAAQSDSPVSPKPLRSAAIGLALGLFVGIGLAFLLETLDTSVRTDADVAEVLRQPVLARIPRISRRLLDESALVTLTEPDGASSESFRMLRTNLSFMNVDGQLRSILLTSCLQGEGKSVTLANLAVTLALGGKKVIVVDADLRRPRMHSYFGLANVQGVSTVVTGQSQLVDSLQAVPVVPAPSGNGAGPLQWADVSGSPSHLYVLTSGPQTPNPGEIVSSARMGSLITDLAEKADIVLVDSPAMLPVGDTAALADKVDGLLFLVEPDVVGRRQLAQAREQLDRLPSRQLGIIVARRKHDNGRYARDYYYRDSEDGSRMRSGSGAQSTAEDKAGVSL